MNKHRHVLLLGSTGVGKSTLGNYMIAPLTGEKVFETSEGTEECTVELRIASKPIDNTGVYLVDTPGLNSTRGKDLVYQMEIMNTLPQLNVVGVIICLKFGERFTKEVKETLKYYSKMFAPVFRAGQVIIIGTKLDGTTFDCWISQMETVKSNKRTNTSSSTTSALQDLTPWAVASATLAENVSTELQIKLPGNKIQKFPYNHLINSLLPISKRESVREEIEHINQYSTIQGEVIFQTPANTTQTLPKSDHMSKEKVAKQEPTIYTHSATARTKIIQQILSFLPVENLYHVFPLPPSLNSKRKFFVQTLLPALINEMKQTLSSVKNQHAALVETIALQNKEVGDATHKVKLIKAQKSRYQGEQKCSPISLSGDDFIYLKGTKLGSSTVLSKNYNITKYSQAHNCHVSDTSYDPEKKLLTVKAMPDLVNIRQATISKGKKRRWFLRIVPTFDGDKYYHKRIDKLKVKLKVAEEYLQECTEKEENTSKNVKKSEAEQVALQKNLTQHTSDLKLLQQEEYKLDEIELVVKVLQRLQTSQNTLPHNKTSNSSNSSNTFSNKNNGKSTKKIKTQTNLSGGESDNDVDNDNDDDNDNDNVDDNDVDNENDNDNDDDDVDNDDSE